MLYALPLLIMLSMLLLGVYGFTMLGVNEDFGGMIGFIIGLYVVRFFNHQKLSHLQPEIQFFK